MPQPRKFQHVLGRSAQTKILDVVWNHRDRGVNIRQVAKLTRQSYVYTIVSLKPLLRHGLVEKTRHGNESILRPNLKHPMMKAFAEIRA